MISGSLPSPDEAFALPATDEVLLAVIADAMTGLTLNAPTATADFLIKSRLFILFWIFGWAKAAMDNEFGHMLGNLSLFDRYAEFLRGILDTGNIIFFVIFTIIWLFLATRVLESDRWR